jgi:hypothetical protein
MLHFDFVFVVVQNLLCNDVETGSDFTVLILRIKQFLFIGVLSTLLVFSLIHLVTCVSFPCTYIT